MSTAVEVTATDSAAREAAQRRLQARRDFYGHLVTYVVVNAAFVITWALTGRGYFWPIWILAFWGVGLVLHAWDTWGRRPITEDDIAAELERGRTR